MGYPGEIWKYSRRDGILLGVAVFQLLATLSWALSIDSFPWTYHFAFFPLMVLVFYFNPIVVTHNFLHCPFFKSVNWNRAFAVLNSVNLGLPQILYKYHHLIHHRYSNDRESLDPSSTWRFGKNGQQEHWASYSAMGLFRDSTKHAFKEVVKKGELNQFWVEAAVSVAAAAFWALISLKWFFLIYLPLFLTGWFLAHMENYFEHYRASRPDHRFANSVSYYEPVYNILMFNEGYHQEHHIRPQEHWTRRPTLREEFADEMEEAGTHVSRLPPLLGFLDHSPR